MSLIEETLQDFNISVTGYQALEKAREQIQKGEFVNISGVAIALAKDNGLHTKDDSPLGYGEVRTHFLEKMDTRMDKTGPDKSVVDLLKNYHRKGVRMGIVTFMRGPRLNRRLEVWKLRQYFQSLVTPEAIERFKPAPEPFIKAMGELNVVPRDCLVVGDEPVDMTGGKKAGAETAGIPCGFFSEEELKQAGADHILESLTSLTRITERARGH